MDSFAKLERQQQLPMSSAGDSRLFPFKLHDLLSDLEQEGTASDVVSWMPHGRSFRVSNQKRFTNEILPRWFQMSSFPSFIRQLNLYGFQRITSGLDRGAYFHPYFLRGNRSLCHRIERIKIKGTGVRQPTQPERQPDFYKYPPLSQSEIPVTSSAKQTQKPESQKPEQFEKHRPHPMLPTTTLHRLERSLADSSLPLQARSPPTAFASQRSLMPNLMAVEPDPPTNLTARTGVSIQDVFLLDRLKQAKAVQAAHESAMQLQRLCAPHDVAQIPMPQQQPEPSFVPQPVADLQNLSHLIMSMQLLQDQPVVQQLLAFPHRDAAVQQPRSILPSQEVDLAAQGQSSIGDLNVQGQSSTSDLNFQQLLSRLALIENRRRELQHFLRGIPPR